MYFIDHPITASEKLCISIKNSQQTKASGVKQTSCSTLSYCYNYYLHPPKKNTCITDFSEYYIQEKKITGHAWDGWQGLPSF